MISVLEINDYQFCIIIYKMKSAIMLFALLSLSMANQATLFAALSNKIKTASSADGVFDTVTEMIRNLKTGIEAE